MGYDHGDNFPFDFEPNGIPFGSKSKGKLSPRSYLIQFERKRKYSFLSAGHYLRLNGQCTGVNLGYSIRARDLRLLPAFLDLKLNTQVRVR